MESLTLILSCLPRLPFHFHGFLLTAGSFYPCRAELFSSSYDFALDRFRCNAPLSPGRGSPTSVPAPLSGTPGPPPWCITFHHSCEGADSPGYGYLIWHVSLLVLCTLPSRPALSLAQDSCNRRQVRQHFWNLNSTRHLAPLWPGQLEIRPSFEGPAAPQPTAGAPNPSPHRAQCPVSSRRRQPQRRPSSHWQSIMNCTSTGHTAQSLIPQGSPGRLK